MNDEINSPGQLRQYEENQGWLPRQSKIPTMGVGDDNNGATLPAPEQVKPMTMGAYAQKVSFNKGDYFSHDNKLYYKNPEGKVSHVTGDAMGDVELNDEQTAQLEKERANLTEGHNTPTRKLTPQDPILHPVDTYNNIKERRAYYQRFYPNEEYSDQRHATMSYWLTKEIGPEWTDLLGIGNEIQGFLWHDLWDLDARKRDLRPWAFQQRDIDMNRRGINNALHDMDNPDKQVGPTHGLPESK